MRRLLLALPFALLPLAIAHAADEHLNEAQLKQASTYHLLLQRQLAAYRGALRNAKRVYVDMLASSGSATHSAAAIDLDALARAAAVPAELQYRFTDDAAAGSSL